MRGFFVSVLTTAAGCARPPLVPADATPAAFLSPSEALPADLDVVVRIDFRKLHAMLGDAQMQRISRISSEIDPLPHEALLRRALQIHADAAWLGFRGAFGPDTVLVVQGDLHSWARSLSPRKGEPSEWHMAAMPAPGVTLYERAQTAERSAPTRIALLREQVAVLASAAEATSLARVLDRGPDAGRLDVPSDGTGGIALRPRAFLDALLPTYPDLARLASDVDLLRAAADVENDELRIDIELAFRSPDAAAHGALVANRVLEEMARGQGAFAAAASASHLRREGSQALRISVRAKGKALFAITGLTPLPPEPSPKVIAPR